MSSTTFSLFASVPARDARRATDIDYFLYRSVYARMPGRVGDGAVRHREVDRGWDEDADAFDLAGNGFDVLDSLLVLDEHDQENVAVRIERPGVRAPASRNER